MADTLIKLKTGTIEKLAQKNANDTPVVPLDKGTVYFAVDTASHVGKIVYDAPDGTNGVDRIVMSSRSEYADRALNAVNADMAGQLAVSSSIDGIRFDGSKDISHYGTCSTEAATAAKVVTCNGFNLVTGAWIAIRFTVTNTAATSNLTLNVSGTGAKGIKYRNANLPEPGDLAANRTYLFVYDGTYYQWVGDRDTDTNTDTTYSAVLPNGTPGLMTGVDKNKLDNIAEFANNVTFTRSLSSGTKIGTITINGSSTDLYSTDNTWTAFKGATSSAAGTAGYINAVPAAGETGKYFGSDGAWHGNASSSTTGLMSSTYAGKLDGIAEGAEVNQNTFANIKVGSTTIAADAKQDTLELVGSNVTLTPDATNDKVTIGITKANVTNALGYTPPTTNTTYGLAASDSNGLMSKEDYNKLQNIADFAKDTTISATSPIVASASTGAVSLTHATSGPSTSGNTSKGDTFNQTPGFGGTFKVTSATVDKYGHTTVLAEHTVTIPNATATTSANGLMHSQDKSKLEAVEDRAQVNVIETIKMNNTALSVSNKAVNIPVMGAASANAAGSAGVIPAPAAGKQTSFLRGDGTWVIPTDTKYSNATSDSAGLMSAADKNKLDGISENAKPGTVTSVATGAGLTGGTITGSGTIKAYLKSETKATYDSTTVTNTENRQYAVTPDKTGYLSVNIPWVNTTYNAATSSAAGLMPAADKAKLDGVASGAQVNVIETVKMNETALAVSNKAVNIPLMGAATSSTAGTAGVVPAPAAGNQTSFLRGDGTWVIPTDTKYNNATTSAAGLMSAADKVKLDGISANARTGTVTSVATGAGLTGGTITSSGTLKANIKSETKLDIDSVAAVTTGTTNRVYPILLDKTGYLAVNVPWSNTTYSTVTSSAAGLMSAADKSKLDAIAEYAKNTTISATSPIVASASTGSVSLTHATSGPSSSGNTSKGDTSNQTPGWGGSFKVTSGTVDKFGHTTAFAEHTVTIPSDIATTSTNGLMSSTDKTKIDGGVTIAGNNVAIGGSIAANTLRTSLGLSNAMHFIGVATVAITDGSTTDPVISGYSTKVAGDVVIDKDSAREYVWSSAGKWEELGPDGSYALSGHTHNAATTSAAGFMSAADKAKLDGISSGAKPGTVTSVATGVGLTGGTITTSGTIKVKLRSETALSNDSAAATETSGRVYPVVPDKSGYLAVNVPWVNTTYGNATSSAAGLMASGDKNKLDGIASGAQVNVIEAIKMNDTALSISSKAVNIPLMGGASSSAAGTVGVVPAPAAGKETSFLRGDGTWVVPTNTTYGNASSSTAGLMSAADKNKLDGISANARTGTVTSVATGIGLTGGTITGSGTIKVKLRSETALTNDSAAATETAGRIYPVVSDKSGYLAVNVPWSNTTYSTATTSANGLMSSGDKNKLDGVAAGAQVNVIESVKMNGTALSVSSKAVNIPLMSAASSSAAGGIGLVPAPGAGKQTSFLRGDGTWVVPTNTTYSNATSSSAGLMSAADKAKLDGIASEAKTGTVTSVATGAGLVGGTITTSGTLKANLKSETKLDIDSVAAVTAGTSNRVYPVLLDKTGYLSVNIPWSNTTYSVATTSANGLMSSGDKNKLDGVASGAQVNVIETVKINGTALSVSSKAVNIPVMGAATSSAAGTIGLVPAPGSGKQTSFLRGDGTWVVPTNTTYSAGTALSLSGTTFNHSNYVTAGTVSEGGSSRTLAFGGTFKVPSVTYNAQGHITGTSTVTLTLPANPNTDTKNTTGSTDTSSKIFLVGATSQAANPQTYSDNQVYATNGQLDANKVRVAEHVTLQYNTTTQSLDFIFA